MNDHQLRAVDSLRTNLISRQDNQHTNSHEEKTEKPFDRVHMSIFDQRQGFFAPTETIVEFPLTRTLYAEGEGGCRK